MPRAKQLDQYARQYYLLAQSFMAGLRPEIACATTAEAYTLRSNLYQFMSVLRKAPDNPPGGLILAGLIGKLPVTPENAILAEQDWAVLKQFASGCQVVVKLSGQTSVVCLRERANERSAQLIEAALATTNLATKPKLADEAAASLARLLERSNS